MYLVGDHPRVGGEKVFLGNGTLYGVGSPPRGRGKAQQVTPSSSRNRITPAWAGKSLPARERGGQNWDHPRVGGEKLSNEVIIYVPMGSPPRGRGKAEKDTQRIIDAGITPAWAGKSFRPTETVLRSRDHPRVGGEKMFAALS